MNADGGANATELPEVYVGKDGTPFSLKMTFLKDLRKTVSYIRDVI